MKMVASAQPQWDFACAWIVLLLALGIAAVYAVHSRRRGAEHYERLDRHGSSIVGAKTMTATYWSMEKWGNWMAAHNITANTVSAGSLITGVAAGATVAAGWFGTAALLAMASGFLDMIDGAVARAQGTSSDAGEVLDVTIDRYTEYAFFAGLVVYYHAWIWIEVVVMAALAGSSLVTYSTAKAEALHVRVASALMRRHERAFFLVTGAGLSAFSIAVVEGGSAGTPLAIPMLVTVALMAVLANVAAVRRMRAIALAVGRVDPQSA